MSKAGALWCRLFDAPKLTRHHFTLYATSHVCHSLMSWTLAFWIFKVDTFKFTPLRMRHVLLPTCNLFCYIAQRFSVFTVMYLKLSWYMYYISIHVCNCPICKEFRARLSYYSYRTLKCVHALCTFWQCTKCWYTCTMYFTKYFAYMHVKILPHF